MHEIYEKAIYIGDDSFVFRPLELCDGGVILAVPESFVDMPPDIAALKYPSQMRAQIIKTSLDTTVNFLFNLLDIPLQNMEVEQASADFRRIVQRADPSAQFFQHENMRLKDETALSWFDFQGGALDGPVYTLAFCTIVDNRLFHGCFNCDFVHMETWRPLFLQVLATIEDISAKGGQKR